MGPYKKSFSDELQQRVLFNPHIPVFAGSYPEIREIYDSMEESNDRAHMGNDVGDWVETFLDSKWYR